MSALTPDRFFSHWLVAQGERLAGLTNAALLGVYGIEAKRNLRARQRRKADFETHRQLVETTVANLAYAVIDKGGPRTIAVSLSKAAKVTRYDRPIFRQLPLVIRQLEAVGVLVFIKSKSFRLRSTIEPSPSFVRQVEAAAIGFEDFGWHALEETIILGRNSREFSPDGSFGKRARRVNYKHDTPNTRRYRREMARINAWIEDADLELVPDGSGLAIDTHRRRLRRYFNLPPWQEDDEPRFDLGGRLFGGWWQSLSREDRHRIRLNGEQVVDLDYSGMFPRLAYLKAGLEPPEGDLYAVSGLDDPRYRDGVKGMMNTLLFTREPKVRMPPAIRKLLPSGWTTAKVREAILSHHPGLAAVIEKGIGFELMFTESQIMVRVLLRLIEEGIVGLPMHDGLMVPASAKDTVRRVMEEVAEEVTGLRLPVSEKAFELGT